MKKPRCCSRLYSAEASFSDHGDNIKVKVVAGVVVVTASVVFNPLLSEQKSSHLDIRPPLLTTKNYLFIYPNGENFSGRF